MSKLSNTAVWIVVILCGAIIVIAAGFILSRSSASNTGQTTIDALARLDVTSVCIEQFSSDYSLSLGSEKFSTACGQEVDDLILRHPAIVQECHKIYQSDYLGLKNCFDRNGIAFSGQFMASAGA